MLHVRPFGVAVVLRLTLLSNATTTAPMAAAAGAGAAAAAAAAAAVVPPTSEQPGALDLYPPSRVGWFSVPLDHFRYDAASSAPFRLKYLVHDGFAGSDPAAPVLFYCGNEGAVELFYNNSGGLFTLASTLRARLVFAEHRYYGASLPFGTGSFTPGHLGALSIEQALADYAQLLAALPTELGCMSRHSPSAASSASAASTAAATRPLCDVVLFGGSYGGMLAAWHRVRYPQLSRGAVASGAPIDFYPGEGIQQAFAAAVSHTFGTYGGHAGCADALTAALAAADAATPAQLAAAGVRACAPMGSDAAERYAFYARGAVASTAMLDYPYDCSFVGVLPANPVQHACAALVAPPPRGAATPVELLAKLHAAVLGLVNTTGGLKCVDLAAELVGGQVGTQLRPRTAAAAASATGEDLGVVAWDYQACTELPLEPITSDGLGFYPERAGKQQRQLAANCAARFGGARPRPGWMGLAFGLGADYRHHSNILFVENEKDPWHVGTASISNVTGVGGTVRRHVAIGGAHHQDLRFASPLDAPGVVEARKLVSQTVAEFLA